jgi:hypothetical protein
MKPILATAAAALALTACSPAPSGNDAAADTAIAVAAPTASPTPVPSASPTADVLALEGLGALKIGQPMPKDSGWASRGAQVSDACTTITSPDHPGVYAIVEQGKVRRITVGQRSDAKLIEGIGVGASEKQVTAAFPGFRATPHKYEAPPAKYLTAPGADGGDPALRFEIDANRKVSAIHVGTAPALFYVEGCA